MNDSFDQTLDALSDFIKCKTDIFLQKKEKHKQILDNQMMKLDNERKSLIKESEVVMNKMSEVKSELMQIEHSYFDLKNKVNSEKQRNKVLKEKIKKLQSENEQKYAQFYKTSELYTTVVNWYKDFLNMSITLEDNGMINVTFKESKKDFKGYPYVKLEMLDGSNFQIIKTHPLVEENNDIMKQIIPSHDIVLFLNKFRKFFLYS